jgi:hypothetical protein
MSDRDEQGADANDPATHSVLQSAHTRSAVAVHSTSSYVPLGHLEDVQGAHTRSSNAVHVVAANVPASQAFVEHTARVKSMVNWADATDPRGRRRVSTLVSESTWVTDGASKDPGAVVLDQVTLSSLATAKV